MPCTPGDKRQSSELISSNECRVLLQDIQNRSAEPAGRPVYLVLCDLSMSMDSNSVEYVRQTALDIIAKTSGTAAIKFYNITKGSRKPFFTTEFFGFPDSDLRPSEDGDYSACKDVLLTADTGTFNKLFAQELKHRSSETYIIQSLQNAFDALRETATDSTSPSKIIVLSDMLESGTSGFGTVNFEKSRYKTDGTLQRIDTFENLPPVREDIEVHLVYYTDRDQNPELLPTWRLIFKKLGYHREINISTELPYLGRRP